MCRPRNSRSKKAPSCAFCARPSSSRATRPCSFRIRSGSPRQTGIKVRVDNESWEDLRPKTAVAANIGSGPDVVLAWNDDPHQYPDKLIDLTEVADYLGKKYGGWYPIAERYGKGADGKWIAMPIGASGGAIVYRKSWVNQAGYETIPTDIDNFLKLAQNLKKNNHPMGFALGNAQGDGNTWTHWLIWAHGGAMVDENNKVIIDSPETVAALEYGKQLSITSFPERFPGSTRPTTRLSFPGKSA